MPNTSRSKAKPGRPTTVSAAGPAIGRRVDADRLERMQVWLHLARGALDLPEADRLYGELGKLAPLSAHGDLAGVAEQARLVHGLAPWKALA